MPMKNNLKTTATLMDKLMNELKVISFTAKKADQIVEDDELLAFITKMKVGHMELYFIWGKKR